MKRASSGGTGAPDRGLRTIGRRVAMSLAVVVLLVSSVAALASRWVRTSLLDSSQVKTTTSRVLQKPAVVAAMSKAMTDQIMDLYRENAPLVELLPKELQDEGKMIEQAVESEIRAASTQIVSSQLLQSVVSDLVAGVHAGALDVATSEQSATPKEAVSLDLTPVLSDVVVAIQDKGIISGTKKLPADLATLSSEAQREALSKALKIEIPRDIAAVDVISAEDLAADTGTVDAIRSAVEITDRTRTFSTAAALASTGVLLWLVRPRRRVMFVVGATSLVAGLVGVGISRVGPGFVPDSDDAVVTEAVRDGISVLAGQYMKWNLVLCALGVLLITGAVASMMRGRIVDPVD